MMKDIQQESGTRSADIHICWGARFMVSDIHEEQDVGFQPFEGTDRGIINAWVETV
jgi:hypothetical protein